MYVSNIFNFLAIKSVIFSVFFLNLMNFRLLSNFETFFLFAFSWTNKGFSWFASAIRNSRSYGELRRHETKIELARKHSNTPSKNIDALYMATLFVVYLKCCIYADHFGKIVDAPLSEVNMKYTANCSQIQPFRLDRCANVCLFRWDVDWLRTIPFER